MSRNNSRINLEHLRKQAKALLRACRKGDGDALQRIRASVPRLDKAPRAKLESIPLADVQHALAREQGFESWARLKVHALLAGDDHGELLRRTAGLVAERVDDAAKVLMRLLGENPVDVAAIVIALGQETCAELMKRMTDEDIQAVAEAISRTPSVTTEQEDEALETFEQMLAARRYVSRGGMAYAEGALAKALGDRKAAAILRRLQISLEAVTERLGKLMAEDTACFRRGWETLDPERRERVGFVLGSWLPEDLGGMPGARDGQEARDHDADLEAVETLEQIVKALSYVHSGGVDFARGALEKAIGPRKTARLLETASAGSGLLRLNTLPAGDASRVLAELGGDDVTRVLVRLSSRQCLRILPLMDDSVQDTVAASLESGVAMEACAEVDAALDDRVPGPGGTRDSE